MPNKATIIGTGGGPSSNEIFHVTLDVKDATIGNGIADVVPTWPGGTAFRVKGVLKVAITSDLTVRVNVVRAGAIAAVLGTFTLLHTTAVLTFINFSAFTSTTVYDDGGFSFDITASDGSKDASGVATFKIYFQ